MALKLKVYIDFSSKIQNELNTYIMKVFCLLIPNGHVDNRNIFVEATAANICICQCQSNIVKLFVHIDL